MRTVFEEEEELARPDPQPDRELTISSTTLLAIFFGLVLICGLFFGLGYTLGRRSPSEAALLPSGSSSSDQLISSSAAKPSAAPQPVVTTTPTPAAEDAQTTDASTAATLDEAAPAPAKSTETASVARATPAAPVVKPALPPATQSAAPAPQQTPASPPASQPVSQPSATPGIMVQIAAISNPADADVLVGALQKRGYSVAAHRAAGDALIHVQVGPFSNRADALAMRQKLLGDGYNAILK